MDRLHNNSSGYPIHEEPIVISKHLLDVLLKQPNPSDLISVYCFYYYTAKWQHTNQPKATDKFCQKGLGIGRIRLNAAQKKLTELGLIQKTAIREHGVIMGWHVTVRFMWSSPVKESNQMSENEHLVEQKKYTSREPLKAPSNGNSNQMSDFPLVVPPTSGKSTPILIYYNIEKGPLKNKIPPTLDMVSQYCLKRQNNIDPKQFYDFYTSKRWFVGKTKMKDWQASVRLWERRNGHDPLNKPAPKPFQKPYVIDDGKRYDLCPDGHYRNRKGDIYFE